MQLLAHRGTHFFGRDVGFFFLRSGALAALCQRMGGVAEGLRVSLEAQVFGGGEELHGELPAALVAQGTQRRMESLEVYVLRYAALSWSLFELGCPCPLPP